MAGNIHINGTIACDPDDLELLLTALPGHLALSRAEPGCLAFDIRVSGADPCVFVVTERFADRAAFDTHTARTRASSWWAKTRHIPRKITMSGA